MEKIKSNKVAWIITAVALVICIGTVAIFAGNALLGGDSADDDDSFMKEATPLDKDCVIVDGDIELDDGNGGSAGNGNGATGMPGK